MWVSQGLQKISHPKARVTTVSPQPLVQSNPLLFPGDPTSQHGKEFLVEKVLIAPEFNVHAKQNQNISEFYADDIALMKLSQKVKMSTHARCLNPVGRVPCRGQCSGKHQRGY